MANDASRRDPKGVFLRREGDGGYLGPVPPLGEEGEREALPKHAVCEEGLGAPPLAALLRLALQVGVLLLVRHVQLRLHLLELLARTPPVAHLPCVFQKLDPKHQEEHHRGVVRVDPREEVGEGETSGGRQERHEGKGAEGAGADDPPRVLHGEHCRDEEGLVPQLRHDDHHQRGEEGVGPHRVPPLAPEHLGGHQVKLLLLLGRVRQLDDLGVIPVPHGRHDRQLLRAHPSRLRIPARGRPRGRGPAIGRHRGGGHRPGRDRRVAAYRQRQNRQAARGHCALVAVVRKPRCRGGRHHAQEKKRAFWSRVA
mmetsp:Transcript_14178/g.36207  ORF Transcript_14178/g.36207 Transcript_14178/m.36207 type:complete len:311 (-) Transcript_14178:99-1031(-)